MISSPENHFYHIVQKVYAETFGWTHK